MIARCGQPEVSWWGWRNADDERLAQSIAEACCLDRGSQESLVNGSRPMKISHTDRGQLGPTITRVCGRETHS